ncbi:hypothetical protein ABZX56_24870 [Streptomyces parvulus]|uniref:hypothetical protein n=1 Tax=Streptomyces parvulus TaxID=146923 RepID=UPI0033A2C7DA
MRFAWPNIVDHVDFDSEAGMLSAAGSSSDLARLKAAVESVVTSPEAVLEIIACAEASGFEFDD